MSNISIKVNLSQFKHVVQYIKGKAGNPVKCLILPVAENSFYEGEKAIYMDIVAFEIKEKKEGQNNTHILKQSFPKEVTEKMTEEQKKALPIEGNAIYWGKWTREPEPQQSDDLAGIEIPIPTEGDDLPF